MTKRKGKTERVKELLAQDEDFVRAAVAVLVQAALEAEMTERIGAEKGERSETRLAYRSGYYSRRRPAGSGGSGQCRVWAALRRARLF